MGTHPIGPGQLARRGLDRCSIAHDREVEVGAGPAEETVANIATD
jgi:hypothetical protein